jgi:hypothetical protein
MSIDEMKKLLVKAPKVKKGSTLEKAGVDGAWMTATQKLPGVAGMIVILALLATRTSVNPFGGGYFEHRERPIWRGTIALY